MKNVLIVGAGRLGKGFIGETFANAGWNITFLDKDPKVEEELKKQGCYHVKVHRVDEIQNRVIKNFKAYTCDEEYSVMDDFLEMDVIVFPLYPEDFAEAGKYLSKCLEKFYEIHPDRKLTMISITNKNYLIPEITEDFRKYLSDSAKEWFDSHVVVRDSIIRRSTDAESNTAIDVDTVAVNSLLIQGPVNNDFSDVEWMEVTDKIEMLKDIKVFVVNGPHASLAFLGYYKGLKTIPEAENDSEISEIVGEIVKELTAAIMKEYPITEKELHNLTYFAPAKGILSDSIYRVAYDPIRKLSKGDRLTGSAELCLKHGIKYDAIAKAMAAGFAYSEPKDKNAQKLQQAIKEKGIEVAVPEYTGLETDNPIAVKVIEEYHKLNS